MTRPETIATAPAPRENDGSVRVRAVAIGLVLALLLCALTPFNNIYRQATPLGGGHFPLAPFFLLVWISLLVALVRKFSAGQPLLTGRELLVAWALMMLVSGIAHTGLARTFFINLTAPFYFATPENRWAEVLQPLIPEAWAPRDAATLKALYNGLPEGRQMGWGEVLRHTPWKAWRGPLLIWGIFVLLAYGAMLCMIQILSRQALENERMNFPLLEVPQTVAGTLDGNGLGAFWGNRFLLAGLMVPAILHLVNGLHFYFPQVPQIPTLLLAGSYFPKQGLLSGFTKLKIYLYPAFIGFAFLAAKQVSLSFWLCFVLGTLLYGLLGLMGYQIPAAALGTTFGPSLARPEETQMIGAYIVFFLFLLWLARHHFGEVLRHGMGFAGSNPSAETRAAMRLPFWGFAACMAGLIAWFHHFGMPPLTALLVLLAFFLTTLVATRVICQGGMAYFTLTAAPLDGLLALLGPGFLSASGWMAAAVSQKVLFLDLRETLMPSLLHARKVTHRLGRRSLFLGATILALVMAVGISLTATLMLFHRYGAREMNLDWATRTSLSVYENVFTLVETPVQPGSWVLLFTLAGAGIMLLLVVCYHRIVWWPLHPIGYLTAYSSAMRVLWVSFFLGWLCNTLCMRYGGVNLFRQVRFFFIGLIVGDFLMGGAWAMVGYFTTASYLVLPE